MNDRVTHYEPRSPATKPRDVRAPRIIELWSKGLSHQEIAKQAHLGVAVVRKDLELLSAEGRLPRRRRIPTAWVGEEAPPHEDDR